MIQQEVLFTEDQRFRQWWLWLIILGADAVFLFWVCKQIMFKAQIGGYPISDSVWLASGVGIILTNVLLFYARLSTQIKKDGIYLKFFPFQWSYKYYNWDMIDKCYVRTYNPLGEYGGWGVRYSMSGQGMAYNVSGNKGLQLELNNHKKVLIGTNKSTELEEVLTKLK
ncbi:hypothetical protein FBD94_16165 [Pedobacter hiemivivus]|uniref:Uncharacterized protein n=1 Tax=Pedobacter hiemivivus TaxID=2530454 RepID=A0A4U1G5X0_9SPHI|nr:DUF6141 family protein [Pedobacter hiemivivus]TKC59075.1 hypothetical protein FBD94_16165 [Pedobacter hiemivivus]